MSTNVSMTPCHHLQTGVSQVFDNGDVESS